MEHYFEVGDVIQLRDKSLWTITKFEFNMVYVQSHATKEIKKCEEDKLKEHCIIYQFSENTVNTVRNVVKLPTKQGETLAKVINIQEYKNKLKK